LTLTPFSRALAAYFVLVWGSGYLASKTGLQYAGPFTFLCLRFALGLALMGLWVMWKPPVWPQGGRALGHVVAAGLLMHAINLAGSHHAQAFGLSAGITALILATQPLLTAVVADRWLRQPLDARQWLGVALGLAGVLLVVWHKVDVQAASAASLVGVAVSLLAVTAGTLYQRLFCADVDLRAAALIQFAASLVVLLPLAYSAGRLGGLPRGVCVDRGGERAACADAQRQCHAGDEPAVPHTDRGRLARMADVRCSTHAAGRDRHRDHLRRRGDDRAEARFGVAMKKPPGRLRRHPAVVRQTVSRFDCAQLPQPRAASAS
jgi:drug/metabolite transporter (DMT)-like permease